MKDLYDSQVLAEALKRVKARDLSPYWVVDHVLPELGALLSQREVTLEITEQGMFVRAVDNGRVVYPVPDTMPGAEDLFNYIIGSGALDYGNQWWQIDEWIGVDENGTVHPGWELRVSYGAEDDPPIEGVLNAATLAQAVMRIGAGAARVKDEHVRACKLLAEGRLDDVDFDIDAVRGDIIMQVAITGDHPVYG